MTFIDKKNTISFIIISVGPNILYMRNTSRNLKYITSRDNANTFLAKTCVSSPIKWRIVSAVKSKPYDSRSTTFQKSYRCLLIREKQPLCERPFLLSQACIKCISMLNLFCFVILKNFLFLTSQCFMP